MIIQITICFFGDLPGRGRASGKDLKFPNFLPASEPAFQIFPRQTQSHLAHRGYVFGLVCEVCWWPDIQLPARKGSGVFRWKGKCLSSVQLVLTGSVPSRPFAKVFTRASSHSPGFKGGLATPPWNVDLFIPDSVGKGRAAIAKIHNLAMDNNPWESLVYQEDSNAALLVKSNNEKGIHQFNLEKNKILIY